jgi:hypothetical protein
MPNELVAEIHGRMPLILAPGDYVRWLSDEWSSWIDAAVPGRTDADVADLNAGQQAGERRSVDRRADWIGHVRRVTPYGFGEVRVATLTLLTFTVLSGLRSSGVFIAKFSGHAAGPARSIDFL